MQRQQEECIDCGSIFENCICGNKISLDTYAKEETRKKLQES